MKPLTMEQAALAMKTKLNPERLGYVFVNKYNQEFLTEGYFENLAEADEWFEDADHGLKRGEVELLIVCRP